LVVETFAVVAFLACVKTTHPITFEVNMALFALRICNGPSDKAAVLYEFRVFISLAA
jgi:hypothetical protein